RMIAWIIDIVIIYLYIEIADTILDNKNRLWELKGWLVILYILPVMLYHLIFEIVFNGQSPGKKIMSIKVITEEGGSPTISQYLLRWMFRIVDITMFGVPGLLAVLTTPKSQRIGDLVAGTIIIDTKAKGNWKETIFEELTIDHKPRYPQVMTLTDKDINSLKSIITTLRKKPDFIAEANIAERVKEKIKVKTDQQPMNFLETLLKDYNYYTSQGQNHSNNSI
ncbi:MAG TPA: RDD family protein, partial [Parasegetibacter sp.]